jgi:hypothetical protein
MLLPESDNGQWSLSAKWIYTTTLQTPFTLQCSNQVCGSQRSDITLSISSTSQSYPEESYSRAYSIGCFCCIQLKWHERTCCENQVILCPPEWSHVHFVTLKTIRKMEKFKGTQSNRVYLLQPKLLRKLRSGGLWFEGSREPISKKPNTKRRLSQLAEHLPSKFETQSLKPSPLK